MEIKRNLRDGSVHFPTDPLRQTEMTITLTDEEVEQAYRERRLYYNMEDIKSRLEEFIDEDEPEDEPIYIDHGVEVSRETLRRVLNDDKWLRNTAKIFDDALSDNDPFMESFWMTAEYVIAEELEGEED